MHDYALNRRFHAFMPPQVTNTLYRRQLVLRLKLSLVRWLSHDNPSRTFDIGSRSGLNHQPGLKKGKFRRSQKRVEAMKTLADARVVEVTAAP